MPEVTLLGFIGNNQIIENQLKKNVSEEMAQWFSAYIDPNTLLCDWLGLKFDKQDYVLAH